MQDADRNYAQPAAAGTAQRFLDSCELLPYTYGLMFTDGEYHRIPKETALATSRQVTELYQNTSGGRLRFKSDTRSITLRFCIPDVPDETRPAYLWTAGFDIYSREEGEWIYRGRTFLPPPDVKDGEAPVYPLCTFEEKKMRELLIGFPMYATVQDLALGVDEDAQVLPAPYPDMDRGPVIFYGSSITQGGCASRPGLAYPEILSRRLDFDYRNLGFSDGARVEEPMLDYLSSVPMRVLVYDYDHNAPTTEFLEKTHEKAFRVLRERMPDLPIVIASAPFAALTGMWIPRHEIICRTYRHAVEAGDTNVYFADGNKMYDPRFAQDCTADATHPNDIGFLCMADAFEPVLREIFNKEKIRGIS